VADPGLGGGGFVNGSAIVRYGHNNQPEPYKLFCKGPSKPYFFEVSSNMVKLIGEIVRQQRGQSQTPSLKDITIKQVCHTFIYCQQKICLTKLKNTNELM